MSTKFVQCRRALLQSAIASSATQMTVTEFVDLSGNEIVSDDIGTVGYGTLAPNTAKEEPISFTIVSNTAGTAVLNITRGLLGKQPYGTGGTAYDHDANTEFILSNNPDLFNKLTAKDNDETVTGAWKFPATPTHNQNPVVKGWLDAAITVVNAAITALDTAAVKLSGNQSISGVKTFTDSPVVPTPTNNNDAATKAYADGIATAGAPNANETTKGLVEEATDAEVSAGTSTGATGAKLFVTPAKLATLLSNRAKVRAYKSDSNTTAGTSYTQVTFGTESYDVGSNFSGNTFTAPRDGYYQIIAQASGTSISTSTAQANSIALYKNGVIFSESHTSKPGSASRPSSVVISDILSLSADDEITVYVKCSDVSAFTYNTGEGNTFIVVNEL